MHLLEMPLRDRFTVMHFDISKARSNATRGKYDLSNIVSGIFQPVGLAWFMIQNRPDLVYTWIPQTWPGLLRYGAFIGIAKLLRVPVCACAPGDMWGEFFARSSRPLRWILRMVLNRIAILHVLSDRLAAQFQGLVEPSRIRSALPGADPAPFMLGERSRSRVREESPTILFIGYLTHAKGALDLLRAAPKIVRAVPDVRFKLVGERVNTERSIIYIDNP